MIFLKKVSTFKIEDKVYLIPVYSLKKHFCKFFQIINTVYLANL